MGNYLSGANETPVETPVEAVKFDFDSYVLGWKRDQPDIRDFHYDFEKFTFLKTVSVDLRESCPPVYDQGKLGSCTANAIAGAYEYDQIWEKEEKPFTPSRLFIYYNERKMEGSVDRDAGAEIRDGIKSINRVGVCPEDEWPYDITKFTQEPDSKCYQDALNHELVRYHRIHQHLDHIRQCLCEGFPIVFGFTVYESFMTPEVATTGVMPMPKASEKALGGHAVMAVGFDDKKKCIIVRNSWGKDWGDEGYFYMPYKYINNPDLCADFWTLLRVKDIGETTLEE